MRSAEGERDIYQQNQTASTGHTAGQLAAINESRFQILVVNCKRRKARELNTSLEWHNSLVAFSTHICALAYESLGNRLNSVCRNYTLSEEAY